MTVFGKLLVFMNLLFSVITGALIVFVFTTRANWEAQYKDVEAKAVAAEAAYKREKASHDNDLKQKDAGAVSTQGEVTRLQGEVTKFQDEAAREKLATAAQTALLEKALVTQKAMEEELKQIKDERTIIVKEKDDLRTKIVDMQKEVDSWRTISVNADLQAKNLQQRNGNLLRQVEDQTVRIRELETTGALVTAGGSGKEPSSIVDPPPTAAPPGVRGKVTGVGTSGTSLAQVNIGSDSGLSPGNVLTVFKGTEYKGDLRLTAVNPKMAVGKFTPAKRTSTIQIDDNVITSFSGTPQ